MTANANNRFAATTILQEHTKNGVPFYRFPGLSSCNDLQHAVFTRLGGVSAPPFASLNVSYDTGDAAWKVRENLRRVRTAIQATHLVYARQVHGSKILVLDEKVRIHSELPYPFQGFDGFVTRLAGPVMMVKMADCQAIFLFDPERRVAALAHAGWRGSVQDIAARTVQQMQVRFRCRPGRILAAIGPSLGPCCAEFRNWHRELPPEFSEFRVGQNHFDFWALSKEQLLKAGLRPENIEIARVCNKCHSDLFYSYRGEGRTGRFAAVIGIRSR